MKNCINCGAPITGDECPYCGTKYDLRPNPVSATFDENDLTGVLSVGGKEFRVYISRMDAKTVFTSYGRDVLGHVCADRRIVHTFTLIEI